MRNLFLALFLLVSSAALAQIPGKKTTEPYQSPSGITYHIGDSIYFLTGSMPDGRYAYVFNQSTLNGSEKVYMTADISGLSLQIKRFVMQGNRNTGYKSFAVVNPSMINFAVDLDQAIKAGEIRVAPLKKDTTLR